MKVHVPCARDAARWLALATVAQQIARGESFAWHELDRLREAATGAVLFGHEARTNPCMLLLEAARGCAASTQPHLYHDALKRHGNAVARLFNDWLDASVRAASVNEVVA